MKANELRIGNWVKHNPSGWSYRNDDGVISNYGKFNEDCFQLEDRDWYALSECTLDIDLIEPIPLTEEWLLKLGWQLDFYSNEYRGNNMIFYNHKNYVSYGMTKLYYVHQLQNLYFALTGEELQIINKN